MKISWGFSRICWELCLFQASECDSESIWIASYRQTPNGQKWNRCALARNKKTDRGRSGQDNRLFIDAILWIAWTGSPLRDLPMYFEHWNSVYSRYTDWTKAGVFQKIFEAVSDDLDMEYVMIDGTMVRVHRHDQSAKGEPKVRRSDVV